MILVMGGTASGKRAYVRSLGFSDADMADAVLDERPVLYNLQALIAENPVGADTLLPALTKKALVLCDEVGCGVIPAEPETRMVRIAVGRLCILLAQRADRVVRMISGMPQILKDTAGGSS